MGQEEVFLYEVGNGWFWTGRWLVFGREVILTEIGLIKA